mmetsp:Transcript_22110/g.50834  ORF Transcript_22110/g.50834 Transcript_22110/m.50834 type:complete len:231 (+) Transcript_22110:260-952(+)
MRRHRFALNCLLALVHFTPHVSRQHTHHSAKTTSTGDVRTSSGSTALTRMPSCRPARCRRHAAQSSLRSSSRAHRCMRLHPRAWLVARSPHAWSAARERSSCDGKQLQAAREPTMHHRRELRWARYTLVSLAACAAQPADEALAAGGALAANAAPPPCECASAPPVRVRVHLRSARCLRARSTAAVLRPERGVLPVEHPPVELIDPSVCAKSSPKVDLSFSPMPAALSPS